MQKTIQLMNKKFLIIAFVLSNLASLAQVKAQNTFYGEGAGQNTTGQYDSAFGFERLASLRQLQHGQRCLRAPEQRHRQLQHGQW